ncbi:MAG TPA: VOC family protein [Ramlibacter sp.]|nr:VOC family protein [Ramlibacter sp.]
MNPVVHFEMPYIDRDRMVKFYESAFGWTTQKLGAEMGNYVVVTTAAPEDDPGKGVRGAIGGGFYERKADWPDQYPSIVIAVKDVKAAMKDVRAAGGEVLGEPMLIPGIGDYVSFRDTEGNRVSMLQPLPNM